MQRKRGFIAIFHGPTRYLVTRFRRHSAKTLGLAVLDFTLFVAHTTPCCPLRCIATVLSQMTRPTNQDNDRGHVVQRGNFAGSPLLSGLCLFRGPGQYVHRMRGLGGRCHERLKRADHADPIDVARYHLKKTEGSSVEVIPWVFVNESGSSEEISSDSA